MKTFEELLIDEIKTQYGTPYHFERTTGFSRSLVTKISQKGIDSINENSKQALAYHLGLSYKGLLRHEIEYDDIPEKPDWIAKKEAIKNASDVNGQFDPLLSEMLSQAKKLNAQGKFKVIEYIKDISATYSED